MTSATIEATDAPVALEIKAVKGRQDAPLEAPGEWASLRFAFTRLLEGGALGAVTATARLGAVRT